MDGCGVGGGEAYCSATFFDVIGTGDIIKQKIAKVKESQKSTTIANGVPGSTRNQAKSSTRSLKQIEKVDVSLPEIPPQPSVAR